MTTSNESGQPTPRLRLRAARRRRGWGQVRAAIEINQRGLRLGYPEGELRVDAHALSRWERGVHEPKSRYIRIMCSLYELSADQLDLAPPVSDSLRRAPFTPTDNAIASTTAAGMRLPYDDGIVLRVSSADGKSMTIVVNRREFLELVGSGVVATVVHGGQSSSDPDLLAMTESLSASERTALSHTIGGNLAAAWSRFHTTDTQQMLAIGRVQLFMLKQHRTAIDSHVLPSFYSSAYRLVGATYHRHGRYDDALRAHQRGYLAALEGGDTWNMAQTRSWQAEGMAALDRHVDSFDATEAALRLTAEQQDLETIRLHARLLSTAADTAAVLGNAKRSDEMLDASGALLEQIPGSNEEFDRIRWLESAGACALRLDRLDLAVTRLEQAMREIPAQWTARHSLTTIALATAYARSRERESALTVARAALPRLQVARSPDLTGHFVRFIQSELLARFPEDRACEQLAIEADDALKRDD